MTGRAGSDLHHLAAQPPHQRGIFAHRIDNDNAILWDSEKHIDDLTLCGKGFAGARGAEIEPVGRFQFFAVSHDDVMGKGVHAVVEGRPGHAELPGHKGNENRRGAGGHAPLDFHLVIAQGQRGHKRLLLLPVQPLQGTVIFLCDAAHGKHIVFQPLPGGGDIDDREREQEHSLVAGLEISQELRRVLAERDQVRGQNVGIVPGPHRLALFLHFHFADVGELSLDGLNGFELIHRLNVHGNGHFRIQLQNFRQELVRELGRQNLQVGRSAPILAHPERPGLPEVEAVRGNKVLCPHARPGNVLPGEAERLPAAGVHLAVEQRQPFLPVHRSRGNAQPFQIACHIGLHPFQAGPGLRDPLGRQPKRDIFRPLDAVVAFGNLIFQHTGELGPDAVKVILCRGDIDLVLAPGTGAAVDKGELERQGAVKVIEKRAPPAENRRLILGRSHGIIDVLIFHGFRVEPTGELAHPVRVHHQIRDRLLGRQRSFPVSGLSGAALWAVCFLQSHPPFSQRPAG